jgi:hypothetical protein
MDKKWHTEDKNCWYISFFDSTIFRGKMHFLNFSQKTLVVKELLRVKSVPVGAYNSMHYSYVKSVPVGAYNSMHYSCQKCPSWCL